MRLKALVPTLPTFDQSSASYEHIVTALESLDIITAEDLILRYSSEELLHHLKPDINSYHFLKLYEEVIVSFTPVPVLGSDLYEREIECHSSLEDLPRLGVRLLDSVLRLPSSGILEVAGLTGTGKTLFVKQTILKYILEHPKATAYWVDPSGAFSPERASQVAKQLMATSHKDAKDPLSRLHIAGCLDLASVYDILEEIETTVKDAGEHAPRPRFVVIDPITPLIGPSLTSESAKGHAHMVTLMRQLAAMSQRYGLTFFLVNTATKAPPPKPKPGEIPPPQTYKPSLGPSYAHLTDVSLFLSRLPLSGIKAEFKVEVIKIRSVVRTSFRMAIADPC